MASDLSSGCTEANEVLDEKEEGEISLEDVSSSEEGHLNDGYGMKTSQCPNCMSSQQCMPWCTLPPKFYHSRNHNRREADLILQDAVQGKENRHHIKESGCTAPKHVHSTLHEKNDDLVPISSDSDMEIVGLADNTKQIVIHSATSRVKKKKKKKRTHAPVFSIDDLVSSSSLDVPAPECVSIIKHENTNVKSTSLPRTHHRDVSPSHRSGRVRLVSRSPPRRHRSPGRSRSPFKKSRSPVVRTRSPIPRRSPRRVKFPKRSPYRSPVKTTSRKVSQVEPLGASHTYVDSHGNVNKLLKKVRQLDAVGTHSLEATLNKNKEHASSLKEKLSNMMKSVSDNNGNVTNYSKEKTTVDVKEVDDADDEEDLALLRQRALETKQQKTNKRNEQPKTEPVKKVSSAIDDDHDEEDLELRMIALHSAVMKKHQNRMQRGIRSGKAKRTTMSRSESPFTQSFLDSIPIPGEDLLNFASPPHTPPPLSENNHTEDMELDTDVEREKEKLPYSPTDKITTDIPIDTELLGIQPSDVSFINLNEANSSPAFSMASSKNEHKSLQSKIVENRSYLPNVPYYAGSHGSIPYQTVHSDTPYSQVNPPGGLRADFVGMKRHNSHLPVHHYSENCNIQIRTQSNNDYTEINTSQELPYSPTDTPMYDPDLSQTLPHTTGSITTSNNSMISLGSSFTSTTHGSVEQYGHINPQTDTLKHINGIRESKHSDKVDTFSMDPTVGSAATSVIGSTSPTGSMITIDDLPETDIDASPLTDTLKETKSAEYIPDNLGNNIKDNTTEPLYMQGVPDITKDANKIPTLINRTLVPVPILRSNKQLQQPLPTRKHEAHSEPTFKSANMQPVAVNEEISTRTNTTFKPMKLVAHAQKSYNVLTTPVAFHDSLHEGITNETPSEDRASLSEHKNLEENSVQDTVATSDKVSESTCDVSAPANKKNKSVKRGIKRKNSVNELNAKESSALCVNEGDTNVMEENTVLEKKSSDNKDELGNNEKAKEHEENEKSADKNSSVHVSDTQNNSVHMSASEISKDKIIAQMQKKESCSPEIKNTLNKNIEDKKAGDVANRTATTNATVEVDEQSKSTDNRRQSLDEDEEALRAILLASLPKRSKTIDANASNSASTVTSNTLNTNNQTAVNQTVQTSTSPVVKTIGTSNSNSASPVPSQHSTSSISENDNRTNTERKLNVPIGKRLSNGNTDSSTYASMRKRPVLMTKAPQKKVMRKIPIPASTKVVNNAKKYQNSIVQKKLILQKVATISGNQKLQSTSVSNVQTNDNKWSGSTKTSLGDTQRIVISLGSDTESDSESERQKKKAASIGATDKQQPMLIPTTEFEKNLEQFLRDVRKKQESVAAARPTMQSTKKDATSSPQTGKTTATNLHTPLAVRHLPASQQEEYRRLKQEILEREKLKLRRTIENNTNNLIASQTAALKDSSITAQQQVNKENNLKNINATKNVSTVNIQKDPTGIVKASNVGKRVNSDTSQGKSIPKPMTNLNTPVPNEKVVSLNSIGDRASRSTSTSMSRTHTVSENLSPLQKVPMKSEVSPGLKILSKDEVNWKYVQIQMKHGSNVRVVTVKDKAISSEKVESNRYVNTSEGKDVVQKNSCDPGINSSVQAVEKEIVANDANDANFGSQEAIDSDASTIVLPRENQNTDSKDSFDTTQSTILFSQYQEERCMSVVSGAERSGSDSSPSSISNMPTDKTGSIEENWEAIRRDVNVELDSLINLPRAEQENRLKDTEQKLVMKRYTILDELAVMSGNLRQWHMERDLQTNLVAEVKKLREQLKIAEERLQLQRNRINSIGPKVVAAHEKIHVGRQECFKLSKVCSVLGTRIVGKEYKVPEAGLQLLDNRLKEVANHTRQLSRKKVPSIDIPEIPTSSNVTHKVLHATHTEFPLIDESLSEKSNIDETSIPVPIENENPDSFTETEENTELESLTIGLEETNQQTEMEPSNELVRDIEQSISEQDNNTLTLQPELSSTPIVLKHCDKTEKTQVLETSRPSTSLESCTNTHTKPESEQPTKKALVPYVSILTHLKVPRNTNPNGVLCPYELMGTCKDGDCQFIHQSESQAK